MKKFTKMDRINELIRELNRQRKIAGKSQVKRCWTGVGHWLKSDEVYTSIGGIFTIDDEFIGFLEGLTFQE